MALLTCTGTGAGQPTPGWRSSSSRTPASSRPGATAAPSSHRSALPQQGAVRGSRPRPCGGSRTPPADPVPPPARGRHRLSGAARADDVRLSSAGAGDATLPVFHHWRFRTGGRRRLRHARQGVARRRRPADRWAASMSSSAEGSTWRCAARSPVCAPFVYDPPSPEQQQRLAALVEFDPDGNGDGLDRQQRRYVRPPDYGDCWSIVDDPTDVWRASDQHRPRPSHRRRARAARRRSSCRTRSARRPRRGTARRRPPTSGSVRSPSGSAAAERLWRRLPDDVGERLRAARPRRRSGPHRRFERLRPQPSHPARRRRQTPTAPSPAGLFSAAASRVLRPVPLGSGARSARRDTRHGGGEHRTGTGAGAGVGRSVLRPRDRQRWPQATGSRRDSRVARAASGSCFKPRERPRTKRRVDLEALARRIGPGVRSDQDAAGAAPGARHDRARRRHRRAA